jgi:ring-1,2-phenylacetyl-CoA epoxidase subunit PaaD
VSTVIDELARARKIASAVVDPEIPVLTIEDLGILRDVRVEDDTVIVTITPTYSGCPALRQIEDDLVTAMSTAGLEARVEVSHNPAWTTDWISDEARHRLEEFGIAPPTLPEEIVCPRCRAAAPKTISRFGSTACKALLVCSACGEPFDYFKKY